MHSCSSFAISGTEGVANPTIVRGLDCSRAIKEKKRKSQLLFRRWCSEKAKASKQTRARNGFLKPNSRGSAKCFGTPSIGLSYESDPMSALVSARVSAHDSAPRARAPPRENARWVNVVEEGDQDAQYWSTWSIPVAAPAGRGGDAPLRECQTGNTPKVADGLTLLSLIVPPSRLDYSVENARCMRDSTR